MRCRNARNRLHVFRSNHRRFGLAPLIGTGDWAGQEIRDQVDRAAFSLETSFWRNRRVEPLEMKTLGFPCFRLFTCSGSAWPEFNPIGITIYDSFSQRLNCNASNAAAISACFLLRPLP